MAAGFLDDAVLFNTNVPPEINRLLQSAVVANRDNKKKAEKLFLQAKEQGAACLQTYFALYKFYFYQKRLKEAEACVQEALVEAAKQGGFPSDYKVLQTSPSRWDMYANEATLFYLYTLKALSFIYLRQARVAEANDILSTIRALDQEDRSGASVVMGLAMALTEEAA